MSKKNYKKYKEKYCARFHALWANGGKKIWSASKTKLDICWQFGQGLTSFGHSIRILKSVTFVTHKDAHKETEIRSSILLYIEEHTEKDENNKIYAIKITAPDCEENLLIDLTDSEANYVIDVKEEI